MAKKLNPMDLKQLIRLHLEGLSNQRKSKTLCIGRNAVNTYMQLLEHQHNILSCFKESRLKHNPIPIFFDNLLNRLTFTGKLTKVAGF